MSIWKDIIGYEGLYQISDKGELRSLDREEVVRRKSKEFTRLRKGKIFNPSEDKDGYIVTSLCKNGKMYNVRLHRLVAESFIPNPMNKLHVNHIDGDKRNNSISNLEWNTPEENIAHAVKTNLRNDKGINNNNAKLSLEDIEYIRNNYIPRHKEFGAKPLGEKFGVHSLTIGRVAKGESVNEQCK